MPYFGLRFRRLSSLIREVILKQRKKFSADLWVHKFVLRRDDHSFVGFEIWWFKLGAPLPSIRCKRSELVKEEINLRVRGAPGAASFWEVSQQESRCWQTSVPWFVFIGMFDWIEDVFPRALPGTSCFLVCLEILLSSKKFPHGEAIQREPREKVRILYHRVSLLTE